MLNEVKHLFDESARECSSAQHDNDVRRNFVYKILEGDTVTPDLAIWIQKRARARGRV
jgi:hypothetical protein